MQQDSAMAPLVVPGTARQEPWIEVVARGISLASALTILLSVIVVLTLDYGRDQGIYAVVAREMLHGAMPYRDVFDFKPPGIFFLFALARLLAGDGHWGIRVLEAASMVGTVAGMMILAERFGSRRIGLLGGALACLLLARQDFWYTAQPESFGGAFLIWGMVLAGRADPTQSRARCFGMWLAAGFLFGFSGLLKPQLAGVGGVSLLLFAARTWRGQRAAAGAALLGLVAGGLLPVLGTLLWFQQRGALHDLHEVLFVFVPQYTKLGWSNPGIARDAAESIVDWLFLRSTPVGMGLLLLVVFRPAREERPLVLELCGALLVSIVGVVLQAKFFPYHWDEVFPITGLLGALGLTKAARAATARGAGITGAAAVALVVVTAAEPVLTPKEWDPEFLRKLVLRYDMARGQVGFQDGWDALSSHWTNPTYAEQNRLAGLYLAAKVKPSAPLFVWGLEPVLYDVSRLPIASRYIYDEPQRARWSADESRAVLMKDLRDHPPAAIVVEHGDGAPRVLGHFSDSAEMVATFPELRDLLAAHYRFDIAVSQLDIYLRNP